MKRILTTLRQTTLVSVLFVLNVTSAHAISLQDMRAKGLPMNAVPAVYYFNNVFNDNVRKPDDQDVAGSFFELDNSYCFFVQPQNRADEDYKHINIWMYDEATGRVKRVYSQDATHDDDLFIYGIDYIADKNCRDSVYHDAKTNQNITMQVYHSTPVLVMRSEIYTGFNHSIRVTLILDPLTGKTIRLDNEHFVSIMHTMTNMLMMAESDLAQDYIITTTAHFHSESANYRETDDFSVFDHQYLTPVVNFYTTRGELVNSVTLPEDKIDMVR